MSIRKAAIWSMASQYAIFAVQFLTSVVLSRLYLTPADLGLFSVALAAAMMLSIFQDMGISRFVTGQPEMQEDHVRDYAAVALATGGGVAAIAALSAWPLARFYGDAGLTPVMLVIAASYALMPIGIVPTALLTRDLRFGRLSLANACSAVGGGAVSIASAAGGAGALALAWGMLATAAIRLALIFPACPVVPRWPRSAAALRPLLGFGSASFVISLSGAIGTRSQDLIVGRMLGLGPTGLFTRASSLAGQLSVLIVGSMNGVFYPAFAKRRDAGEHLGEPYLHLVACNTALNWPAMVGLSLAAEPVVNLLFGPRWSEVAPLLRWVALAEMFFVAIPLQMDIPILLGRIRKLVWINLFDTAATVAILAVFCLWGVEAAAISRIAVGALWFVIYIGFIGHLLDLSPLVLLRTYGKSAFCAAAAGLPLGIAGALGHVGPDTGLPLVLSLSLAGVGCWLVALPLVRHPAWQEFLLLAGNVPVLRQWVPQA